MTERPETEVIEFAAALADCDEHRLVIALFGPGWTDCVAILKCSETAARGLIEAVGSALSDGTS